MLARLGIAYEEQEARPGDGSAGLLAADPLADSFADQSDAHALAAVLQQVGAGGDGDAEESIFEARKQLHAPPSPLQTNHARFYIRR